VPVSRPADGGGDHRPGVEVGTPCPPVALHTVALSRTCNFGGGQMSMLSACIELIYSSSLRPSRRGRESGKKDGGEPGQPEMGRCTPYLPIV